MPGKTILVDGHSLAHRAYHALPPQLTDPEGKPVNAVLGFCNMLLKLIEQEEPVRVVCAFDNSGPVFRHEDFADYKATRKPMEQQLREQMPVIKQACCAFGAEVVEKQGFEADDLLGTMSRMLEENGLDAVIVTSDRDAYQLASESVKLMMTKKGLSEFELLGPAEVEAACGVGPGLVPDLKGLIGDASDNIPGVKGIGEKTAAKLIKEKGALEDVLKSVGETGGDRIAKLLREGAEMAVLSKKLATIDRNVPMDFDPLAKNGGADLEVLKAFLSGKGFRNLIAKLPKAFVKKPGAAEADDSAGKTRAKSAQAELFGGMPPEASFKVSEGKLMQSPARKAQNAGEVRDIVLKAAAEGAITLDIMCEGIGWTAQPSHFIAASSAEAVWTKLIPEGQLPEGDGIALHELVRELSGVLSNEKIQKRGWDIKSTAVMLGKQGAPAFGANFDPMLASFLINPLGRTDEPKDLLFKYFKDDSTGASDDFDARLKIAASMPALEKAMTAELGAMGMGRLYNEVEMPLVEPLAVMELNGVKVDVARLHRISDDMKERLAALQDEIFGLAGGEFNIGSPKQLASVLFEKLGLPAEKKTKTGYSTDADVLEGLLPLHPIIGKILDYRGTSKLKSTYVDVLPALSNRHGGRIHTTFNQTGAVTGRLSSADPNMQNIPIKSEEGLEIRAAFIAERGNLLVSADYSQIELRLLAHLSADPVLVESFRLGQDVHTRTASEVFGVPMDKVSREMRNRAKTVNFGVIYGQSEFGLSRTLGIAQSEAREFIGRYFERYTGVKDYFAKAIEDARRSGYVSTIMGRRRPLPELFSGNFNMRKFGERIVMNAPIQGSAADIIKVAMIRLLAKLRREMPDARMLLQVHDELVLEVPEGKAAVAAGLVKSVMEEAATLAVPLVAHTGIGSNWKQAK